MSKYWLSGSISKTTTIICLYCNNITESCLFLNLGRQTHKAFFEKSDLFFVCMMKPLSLEINAQESEIEAAQVTFSILSMTLFDHQNTYNPLLFLQWMPWGEYNKQPFVQNHELLRYMTDICSAKTNGHYEGFTPLPVSAPDLQGNLYFNNRDLSSRQ